MTSTRMTFTAMELRILEYVLGGYMTGFPLEDDDDERFYAAMGRLRDRFARTIERLDGAR